MADIISHPVLTTLKFTKLKRLKLTGLISFFNYYTNDGPTELTPSNWLTWDNRKGLSNAEM